MERDQALYILTASRLPTWPERERWYRLFWRGRNAAVVVLTLLTLFFIGYIGSASAGDELNNAVVRLILGAAGVWMVVFLVVRHRSIRNRMHTDWYNEQADRKRLAAGHTVALYGDRVVRTDLRGATTMYFSAVTACTETADGICLSAGATHILIRGGDLTPEQLYLVREHLRERLPGRVFHVKKPAVAGLADPLAIPVFASSDEVLFRAAMAFPRPALRSRRNRELTLLQRGFVLPAMLVYGTGLAVSISVTEVFLLDLLLFCAGTVAGGLLLTWLLTRFDRQRTVVSLAVTREGLAAFTNGRSDFIVWERCRPTAQKAGLHLLFADGNALKIPWSCFEQPEAIQDFLRR